MNPRILPRLLALVLAAGLITDPSLAAASPPLNSDRGLALPYIQQALSVRPLSSQHPILAHEPVLKLGMMHDPERPKKGRDKTEPFKSLKRILDENRYVPDIHWPPLEQKVVEGVFKGWTRKQIASQAGVTISKVASAAFRAEVRLRRFMARFRGAKDEKNLLQMSCNAFPFHPKVRKAIKILKVTTIEEMLTVSQDRLRSVPIRGLPMIWNEETAPFRAALGWPTVAETTVLHWDEVDWVGLYQKTHLPLLVIGNLDSIEAGQIKDGDTSKIDATVLGVEDLPVPIHFVSHAGRPKSGPDPRLSLKPVVDYLNGRPQREKRYQLAAGVSGPSVWAQLRGLRSNERLVGENVRFDPDSFSPDAVKRRQVAEMMTHGGAGRPLYMGIIHNDFATPHGRTDFPYTLGVDLVSQEDIPSTLGPLLLKETESLDVVRRVSRQPFVLSVGGGFKANEKIPAIVGPLRYMTDQSTLIVSGLMGFAFLSALAKLDHLQISLGGSQEIVSVQGIERIIEEILLPARQQGVRVILPEDHVIIDKRGYRSTLARTLDRNIPDGMVAKDVGIKTRVLIAQAFADCRMAFINGGVGVFENPMFREGTNVLFNAALLAKKTNDALVFLGGGDTAKAVPLLELQRPQFTHISTGGGGALKYISLAPNEKLPAIIALEAAASRSRRMLPLLRAA